MVNELRGRELWLTSSEVADWVASELRGRGLMVNELRGRELETG